MEVQVSDSGTAPLPPSRKRSKPKAPAPPTFSKHVETSIVKGLDGENITMEQRDNFPNTHLELIVVLPGGVERSTSINGSKPMMDLLIFLCGKYHLNPSSHTIELLGREKNQIRFKPNTLIGTLEVEKVILKQKNMEEKKKPTSMVPEQTVRVVVNYKKTQKTIVRVSPHVPLQELVPVISNKCEFDPKSTILVKDFECQEPYDLTKSLKELGLREVYAVDTSIGCSQGNFQGGSIQRASVPSSAPATPLISQQRPLGMSSSSAYCPTYESNTLPSDLPKKRRAPAPPLSVSQSFPKDLSQQASARPSSYVFPDDTEQDMTGSGRQRAESLPLGGVATSSRSSLRKTKRKAPLPPSKTPGDQKTQDNTTDSNLGSVVSCPSPDAADMASVIKISSTSAGIGPEHNLEEIVETEEMRPLDIGDAEGTFVQKGEEALYPHVSIDFSSNSENAQISVPNNTDMHSSSTATDKQPDTKFESKLSAAEDVYNQIVMEKDENSMVANMDKDLSVLKTYVEEPPIAEDTQSEMDQRASDEMSSFSSMLPLDKGIAEKSTQALEVANIYRDSRTSLVPEDSASFQSSNVTVENQQNHSDKMEINELKVEEINCEEVNKTLDFQSAQCTETVNGAIISSPDRTLKNTSVSIQNPQVSSSTQPVSSEQQNCVSAATKSTDPTRQVLTGKQVTLSIVNQPATESLSRSFTDSHGPSSTKDTIRSPESPTKTSLIYKCESEPKPKPSNEITREYIPKIGMTTYKIVPSKTLEKETFVASGIMPEAETVDQQTPISEYIPKSDISKNSAKQSNTTEEPLSSITREPAAFHQEAHFDKTVKWALINSTTQSHHPEATVPKLFTDSESSQPKVIVNRKTQSTSDSKMKPGSVFLQQHKRSSGQYVISALARDSSLPSQSSLDGENTFSTKEENGVPFQEVSPTNEDDVDVIIPPPPEFAGISEENAQKELSKSGETPASRSSRPPKVPSKPSIRVKLSDTKALRTTDAAKTYTPTSPSPFALAVSSAVRKSQTNATCSFKPKHAETDSSTLSSPTNYADKELHLPSSIPKESYYSNISKQTGSPERETKKDCSNKAAETETQHIQLQLPSPLRKSKPTLISQISAPGDIHQAVLDAIRSGEGAAKLKKVDTFTTM
ncbi:cordon-bleu protein-like 1b [Heptranchias perlo]|uniref:cordon-bleu protein-like 1b n=1 Tax=Heptranchias perlo TaxID=212740 RepID=UPI00355979B1